MCLWNDKIQWSISVTRSIAGFLIWDTYCAKVVSNFVMFYRNLLEYFMCSSDRFPIRLIPFQNALFWWPFSSPKHKSVNDGSISTSLPLPSQHLIKPWFCGKKARGGRTACTTMLVNIHRSGYSRPQLVWMEPSGCTFNIIQRKKKYCLGVWFSVKFYVQRFGTCKSFFWNILETSLGWNCGVSEVLAGVRVSSLVCAFKCDFLHIGMRGIGIDWSSHWLRIGKSFVLRNLCHCLPKFDRYIPRPYMPCIFQIVQQQIKRIRFSAATKKRSKKNDHQ